MNRINEFNNSVEIKLFIELMRARPDPNAIRQLIDAAATQNISLSFSDYANNIMDIDFDAEVDDTTEFDIFFNYIISQKKTAFKKKYEILEFIHLNYDFFELILLYTTEFQYALEKWHGKHDISRGFMKMVRRGENNKINKTLKNVKYIEYLFISPTYTPDTAFELTKQNTFIDINRHSKVSELNPNVFERITEFIHKNNIIYKKYVHDMLINAKMYVERDDDGDEDEDEDEDDEDLGDGYDSDNDSFYVIHRIDTMYCHYFTVAMIYENLLEDPKVAETVLDYIRVYRKKFYQVPSIHHTYIKICMKFLLMRIYEKQSSGVQLDKAMPKSVMASMISNSTVRPHDEIPEYIKSFLTVPNKLKLTEEEMNWIDKKNLFLDKSKITSSLPRKTMKNIVGMNHSRVSLAATTEKRVRCPKGTRFNKKTGKCEPSAATLTQLSLNSVSAFAPSEVGTSIPTVALADHIATSIPAEHKAVSPHKTTEKQKRCPKGTRRNKKTGECEPIAKVSNIHNIND